MNTIVSDKILYSWNDFDNDTNVLYSKLINSGWTPDYIVGVKRGGLIPAIKLSHSFKKPMIMMTCQLRDNKDEEIKLLEAEHLPRNKNILIVDDICDSGVTFSKIVLEFMMNGFYSVKTCALYHNISQNFFTDYNARIIDRSKDDRWIIFPWES